MKKLSVLVFCGIFLAAALTGCAGNEGTAAGNGSSDQPAQGSSEGSALVYLKDFNPDDYVTLGEYKGIEISLEEPSVTDEEIQERLDSLVASYKTYEEVTDRDDVRNGDIANIDYEGKKDGVAFEGGTAKGYDLGIGTGTFIPGFEDGLIGMKVGETRDVPLTFPENYGNADLAGQDVIFTVTVNGLKIEKETVLDDAFAAKLGTEEDPNAISFGEYKDAKTVEDLKEIFRKELEEKANSDYEKKVKSEIVGKIEEGCTFKEAPAGLRERLINTGLDQINQMAQSYGVDPATVATRVFGMDGSNYEQSIRDYYGKELTNQYIMMAAIAKKEGITVSDEEMDAEIQSMLDGYGNPYTLEEYKKLMGDLEAYREDLVVNRVIDEVLVKNAKVNGK
ncbi:MAG: trigger factor [Lachnospiraceae bacterium]|nr:trigger factor [Lachnospiraceae bacterium]